MRVLDLFSGIGLMALGLEWAGMTTVGMCEIDEWNRGELARNFPGMWIHDDVRTLATELVAERCGRVDIIAGGFPCQPASVAGKRKGEADERWLWPEFARIVAGVRPAWVLAENVPGLRTLGADRVLSDLGELGYACWPLVVGADDVGAPHRRKRVWIVAHDARDAGEQRAERLRAWVSGEPVANAPSQPCISGEQEPIGQAQGGIVARGPSRVLGNATSLRCGQGGQPAAEPARGLGGAGEGMADAEQCKSGERHNADLLGRRSNEAEQAGLGSSGGMADADSPRPQINPRQRSHDGAQLAPLVGNRWPSRPGEPQHDWEAPRLVELPLGFATDGSAGRLARRRNKQCLKALGNAVVPQVAEAIGRAIMRASNQE